MKSSRMKFAKKLKSMRAGEYLNQDRILQVLSAADEFLPKISNPISQITSASMIWNKGDEENVPPLPVPIDSKSGKRSFGSGFRRPELNSATLFDPKLLEAFHLAVGCFDDLSRFRDDYEDLIFFPADQSGIEDAIPPVIVEQDDDTLCIGNDRNIREKLCPPRGEESVVFYTTTLRGIRKTFDDCNLIRFLLDSFKVKYYERDVSMHRHYREELRRISAAEVLPPLLFVKGRCIGGAQRVLSLHEQGKFRALFEGVSLAGDKPCMRCDGFRFLICDRCRGSRRIVSPDASRIQCLLCNENGLIVCLHCS